MPDLAAVQKGLQMSFEQQWFLSQKYPVIPCQLSPYKKFLFK